MPQGVWAGRSEPACQKGGWHKWVAPRAPGFWSPGGGSDPGASHRQLRSPPGFGVGTAGVQESQKADLPALSSPGMHILPLPACHILVLSGTPGYPRGAGSHGFAAQTLHRPPGNQPLEPGEEEEKEKGPGRPSAHAKLFLSSQLNTFCQFPFGLSLSPSLLGTTSL